MSRKATRRYVSQARSQAAEVTRERVLDAAKRLFADRGIDQVTIAQIAHKASVSLSTVYSLYKSKEGILRGLMRSTLFGPAFQTAFAKLRGENDPVRLIALTSAVARAIYESESSELGLMRGASLFSAALRRLEKEFEELRFEMQKEGVELLFAQSKQKAGLSMNEARRILWMYTSRDVYRLLVHEGGWTPQRYQRWLSNTLLNELVDQSSAAASRRKKPDRLS